MSLSILGEDPIKEELRGCNRFCLGLRKSFPLRGVQTVLEGAEGQCSAEFTSASSRVRQTVGI